MTALALIAMLSLLAWLYLLFFHGAFWRADQRLAPQAPSLERWPDVVIVIPARNEAETIAEVVRSHSATDYGGAVRLIVVDDSSDDGTGDIARKAADGGRVQTEIVAAPPLGPGWSGKLWALNAGLARAAEVMPEARYVLLTDADIVHAPSTLGRLVAKAETEGLALASLMARLDARGFWGALTIPAFIFFFQKLYPFPRVNDPTQKMAAAAGGCVLVRRDALDAIGGVAAIKGALIDDCSLAAEIKGDPPSRPIWLGLAEDAVVSRRDNRALGSVWSMVARTAFTQLRYSLWLLIGSTLGMALIYLAPPVAFFVGLAGGDDLAAAVGGAAWLLSAGAYAPTLQLYRLPMSAGLALPFTAALYMAMTISSAVRHWRGAGGRWKGRVYSAKE